MRINKPLSREQLKMGDLIKPGIYEYEVIEAEEKVSQAGNDMIALKLNILLPNDKQKIIYDYLLEAMEWKVGHFCESLGMLDDYEQNYISAAKCQGKKGLVKVFIQKDPKGLYPDKNSVQDYIASDKIAAIKMQKKESQAENHEPFIDDVLPF